jgi:3-oxoacyl-[acyl-carrier protein] reductase
MHDPGAPLRYDLNGHVALITGANHGIGAATAEALAGCGALVLVSYLRMRDPEDFPEPYRANPAKGAEEVLAAVRMRGGRAAAIEADLRDPAVPARLFDFAEAEMGPVDILVNNATGWVSDTFTTSGKHATGVTMAGVSAATYDQVFSVDARGGALMIAEFARRHVDRQATWRRIIGLTSGEPLGFPNEVSYGAAKAAQENYTMSAGVRARTVRRHGEHRRSTGHGHGLGERCHPRTREAGPPPDPHRRAGGGGRGDRVPVLGSRPTDHGEHRPLAVESQCQLVHGGAAGPVTGLSDP